MSLTTQLCPDGIDVTSPKGDLIARIVYDIAKRDAYGRDEHNDSRYITASFPELEDDYTRAFNSLEGAEAYVWAVYVDMLRID